MKYYEKLLQDFKPLQIISNMENRIQINGTWYVKEDQPETSFKNIDECLIKSISYTFEAEKYTFEAKKLFKDDGESLYSGTNITVTNKENGETEYWDNDHFYLGVYNGASNCMYDIRESLDEESIKEFRNLIHKLIQIGWLSN